ncbi:MAG: holo-ACP synthase [Epsilonproteobacteria bacterium]|nr:holo-ACP synthase [Campylobacterota bacterium]
MIGIDIIKIDRMEKMLEKFGNKALERFLSNEEIALVHSPKTAAGFWAIKEAVSKALGTGIGKECSFKDIRIYKTPANAPKIALSHSLINKFSLEEADVSLTHDGGYAIAVVYLKSLHVNSLKGF